MSLQPLTQIEARLPVHERLTGDCAQLSTRQAMLVKFAVRDYRPTGNLSGISMR